MGVKKSRALSNTVVYIIMTIMALIIIYPVFYALCGSLKTNLQLMSGESLLPTTWEFQNFIEVWKKANFAQYTFNSLFICFFSTLGAVLLSSLTAFCIERCDFPGRKFVKNLYLMTMFIALGAVTLRPLYTLAVNVGIQNSLWPIILITIGAQGSNVFLVSKFIAGLPKELDEAAIIDGCGPFRLFWQVLLPLLKPNASIYVCCDWRSSPIIGLTLKEYFRLQNRITWQREKGRGAQHNWKNGMEDIWFATRTDDYTFHVDAVKMRRRVRAPYRADGQPKDWEDTPDGKFRNTCPSNFWDDISVPYWSMPENTAHPTQKPEKLLAKLILASSDPGGIVLDPFAGSGSTAVTARKLGRRFVAIERSEQYCAWAEKRLEMAADNPAIQGYADGVFWERNAGRLPR